MRMTMHTYPLPAGDRPRSPLHLTVCNMQETEGDGLSNYFLKALLRRAKKASSTGFLSWTPALCSCHIQGVPLNYPFSLSYALQPGFGRSPPLAELFGGTFGPPSWEPSWEPS